MAANPNALPVLGKTGERDSRSVILGSDSNELVFAVDMLALVRRSWRRLCGQC